MGVIYILTSVVKSYDDKGKLLLGPDVKNVKHGRNLCLNHFSKNLHTENYNKAH